ncbi:hypothetical protein [Sphingomonas sp. MMS24-J13]|uniref:hypothetical protein n=1 Tax=Sphingomonas sp. MMS24-J13 TaxID=3238686 RepID=UPI003850B74D
MMALTLGELYASPDHYLHSFDGDAAVFVPMDRAAYHRSIFLDGRISPAADGELRVPLAALGHAPKPLPTAWIFHVAHCGSTLLARALDQVASNLVLREPLALRQSAIRPNPGRLALVAAMVSKRYRADAATIVKANVPVNFLLPDLAAFDPDARAIFLHLGLRDYLLAILRSNNHREWLARVTGQLSPYLGDMSGWSDARRAAALWLAQTRAFAGAIAAMPQARSLNAELFFADPRAVLRAATTHFGVAMAHEAIDRCIAGPLFATYSKNPDMAFDNDVRIARRDALAGTIEAELVEAETWVGDGAMTAEAALTKAGLIE